MAGRKRLGLPLSHSAGMKKKNHTSPQCSPSAVLRKIANLTHHIRCRSWRGEPAVDRTARTFSPWSHLVSLIYPISRKPCVINDICDGLRLHNGLLVMLRGATSPSRKNRDHPVDAGFSRGISVIPP